MILACYGMMVVHLIPQQGIMNHSLFSLVGKQRKPPYRISSESGGFNIGINIKYDTIHY
ncbi:transcriptional regulator [Paenibacillus sp. NAIST15-1]|nr:transcriptional regulator [Paenibacillus sp. NAIST15-1]